MSDPGYTWPASFEEDNAEELAELETAYEQSVEAALAEDEPEVEWDPKACHHPGLQGGRK